MLLGKPALVVHFDERRVHGYRMMPSQSGDLPTVNSYMAVSYNRNDGLLESRLRSCTALMSPLAAILHAMTGATGHQVAYLHLLQVGF
jgi:hypothetical protein